MAGRILTRYNIVFFAIICTLSILSFTQLSKLKVNQDFNDFLPRKDNDVAFYKVYEKQLANEENMLSLAVTSSSSIFDSTFLHELNSLSLDLEKISLVEKSIDLTRIKWPQFNILGIGFRKLINIDKPKYYSRDSFQIMSDERINMHFVSPDAKSAVIFFNVKEKPSSTESAELIQQIEIYLGQYHFKKHYFSGRIYWEYMYSKISTSELSKGVIGSLIVIVLISFLLYSSVWMVLINLFVYFLSMINVFAYYAIIGRELDTMSVLIPSVILVVSISDVIHIITKFKQNYKSEIAKDTVLAKTLNEVSFNTFITSLTTALGFATLAVSKIIKLQTFGPDVAVGVIITFFVSIFLMPFLLRRINIKHFSHNTWIEKSWLRLVTLITWLIRKKGKTIWLTLTIVSLVSIIMISKINRNHKLIASFPNGSELLKAGGFYEQTFKGLRPFEMAIVPQKENNINDLAVLEEIDKLHAYLDSSTGVTAIYSPVTYYKSLNKAFNLNSIKKYVLPKTQSKIKQYEVFFDQNSLTSFFQLFDSSRSLGRIYGRMPDLGVIGVKKHNDSIDYWVNKNIDTSLVKFRHTGSVLLADKVELNTVYDLLLGLFLAILMVGIITSIIFKNIRFVGIVMLVNFIPLVIVAALMPVFDISLRFGTSIIFTIGFVIITDDTIHMIANFKHLIKQGVSNHVAITIMLQKTGLAVLKTSVILFFAFIFLATSTFKDASAVGILLGTTIFVTLFFDSILVPLLLRKK